MATPLQSPAHLGIEPGPIDVSVDGSGLRIEIPVVDEVVERDGFLMIDGGGPEMTADLASSPTGIVDRAATPARGGRTSLDKGTALGADMAEPACGVALVLDGAGALAVAFCA